MYYLFNSMMRAGRETRLKEEKESLKKDFKNTKEKSKKSFIEWLKFIEFYNKQWDEINKKNI